MNSFNEFNEKNKSRCSKNKSKARRHQKRLLSDQDLSKHKHKQEKKTRQHIKNFKKKNAIERNPIIYELRV